MHLLSEGSLAVGRLDKDLHAFVLFIIIFVNFIPYIYVNINKHFNLFILTIITIILGILSMFFMWIYNYDENIFTNLTLNLNRQLNSFILMT